MARKYASFVQEQDDGSAIGTSGDYVLAGAVAGFQAVAGPFNDQDTGTFAAVDGTDFEVFEATYNASEGSLTRDTVLESSNANSPVDWGSTVRTVACVMPAGERRDGVGNAPTRRFIETPDLASNGGSLLGTAAEKDTDQLGLQSVQVFTSSGTWNRPSGIAKVRIQVIGAGGGGGNAYTDPGGDLSAVGGGGGGGEYRTALLDVSSILSSTITIGSGGAGGSNSSGSDDGSDGGSSSWSDGTNTISANGGSGGFATSSIANMNAAEGGAGGTGGSGGDVSFDGGPGGFGICFGDNIASFVLSASGQGGNSGCGGGGAKGEAVSGTTGTSGTSRPGVSANSPGGGGSGAATQSADRSPDGGDGADGVVIVWEYA